MSKEAAETLLLDQIRVGEQQERKLIQAVAAMVIRDRLVPPNQVSFEPQYDDFGGITLKYDREPGAAYRIHRHALGQLAAKIRVPMTFVNYLLEGNTDDTIWRREELAQIFTTHFHKEKFKERGGRPPAFLHRLVGSELRGFLSRSFNRHLASEPMLKAFVLSCRDVNARAVEAITTDVKLSLKCFRQMIFEPVPGEFIAVGVDWSNSDFGSGKLSVSSVAYRVRSRTAVSLSEEISKVHLGSVIEESDIEMSEETMAKEVEAQASAIRDSVKQLLSQEYVETLLKAITRAHEEEIPWNRLKGQLSKFLYKEELATVEGLLASESIVDLPPVGKGQDGKPLPTRWWASNIISILASRTQDDERKIDLQKEAGRILGAAVREEEKPASTS